MKENGKGVFSIFLGCCAATIPPAVIGTLIIFETAMEFFFGCIALSAMLICWICICFEFCFELFCKRQLNELGAVLSGFRQRFLVGYMITMLSGGAGATVFGLIALVPYRPIVNASLTGVFIFLVLMGLALPLAIFLVHKKYTR